MNEKVPGSHHEMATEWSWRFLDWHIERLIESAIGIKNKRFDQHVRKDALLLQQDLRNAIVFSITNLLSHAVAALRDSTQHDLKAVLFLEIASDSYEVYAFIDSINDPFNSTLPINTLIYGSPRSNPAYKDTQWMTDRLYITEKKPDTVTEMVLHKGPFLYEGMVSNFWVLLPSSSSAPYDYILQTAPFDLVLVGIISRAIIEVAKATNIKVVFKCPDMNDISSWIGCFTTSKCLCPYKSSNPNSFPSTMARCSKGNYSNP